MIGICEHYNYMLFNAFGVKLK